MRPARRVVAADRAHLETPGPVAATWATWRRQNPGAFLTSAWPTGSGFGRAARGTCSIAQTATGAFGGPGPRGSRRPGIQRLPEGDPVALGIGHHDFARGPGHHLDWTDGQSSLCKLGDL